MNNVLKNNQNKQLVHHLKRHFNQKIKKMQSFSHHSKPVFSSILVLFHLKCTGNILKDFSVGFSVHTLTVNVVQLIFFFVVVVAYPVITHFQSDVTLFYPYHPLFLTIS